MQVKIEVCSIQSIEYTDKKTGRPASFEVIHVREAKPATFMKPMRLSRREFPSLQAGSEAVISISDFEMRHGELNVKGNLVNAK